MAAAARKLVERFTATVLALTVVSLSPATNSETLCVTRTFSPPETNDRKQDMIKLSLADGRCYSQQAKIAPRDFRVASWIAPTAIAHRPNQRPALPLAPAPELLPASRSKQRWEITEHQTNRRARSARVDRSACQVSFPVCLGILRIECCVVLAEVVSKHASEEKRETLFRR